jgi:beta-phosphoglucomutase-like phosphatase (HAD superfamily)
VLIESEYIGNKQIAETLSGIGHPTTVEQAMANFMGLSGRSFLDAVESWIGKPVPDAFHSARRREDERVLREGIAAVAGAVQFIETLPPDLPRAIASSSSPTWKPLLRRPWRAAARARRSRHRPQLRGGRSRACLKFQSWCPLLSRLVSR